MARRAYRLEGSPSDWLGEIGESLRHYNARVRGCFAFNVHREDGNYQLSESWCEDPSIEASLQQTFASAPPGFLDMFFSIPLAAQTASEILGQSNVDIDQSLLGPILGRIGARDIFSVAAFGPSGRGAVLGMLVEGGERAFESETRQDWMHVAVHVAAGSRLRQRLGKRSVFDEAEAIFRPDGKAEHLVEPDARELLQLAVQRLEHVRNTSCSTRESLELWQGLVDGRWSVIERFDSDGRRFYVALKNPPAAVRSKALTRREAEVVAYVASGAGTKAAAYSLGIGHSTVRGYLAQAMDKLGITSRAELIELRQRLLGPG